MKNIKLLIASLLVITVFCKAQTPQNFDQLKPVANPAYMLLGVSPTNIERPTTPKEFVAGIQNATVNGKLAPNFAMELTPYELLNKNRKKDYTFKAYDYIMNKDWVTNFQKSIALSFATSQSDTVSLGRLKKGTSAAVGIKMLFINGKAKKQTVESLTKLANAFEGGNHLFMLVSLLKAQSATISWESAESKIDATLNTCIDTIQASTTLSQKEKSIKVIAIQTKFEALKEDLQDITKNDSINVSKMIDIIEEERKGYNAIQGKNLTMVNSKFAFAREGFMLEGSAALLSQFEYNSWDSVKYAKFGVWLTPSYKWNLSSNDQSGTASFDAIGLVRYTANSVTVDSSSYIDAGLKLQFVFNKLSFSGEYIYRQLTQKPQSIHYDFTDRLTANLEYVLTPMITLKASVGRTFDGNSVVYDTPNNKIFAMGGINLSFLNGQ